jgi:hypothetical protein
MIRRGWASSLLPAVVSLLLLAGCSNDGGGPACGAPAAGQARAPEADSLCASGDTCSTSGQPDHQGCPNTCSCLCHEGLCYQRSCTAIASCAEPPVYR